MKLLAGCDLDRRGFLVRAMPACAIGCLAMKGVRLSAAGQQAGAPGAPPAAPKHKFDAEVPFKPTYRQFFQIQYASTFIPLVKVLKKNVGQEKTIALLKQMTEEEVPRSLEAAAKRLGGRDFAALKRNYNNPQVANVWTPEIVQDTDTVYELKVTECLWAETFRKADLAEEGYAAVCYGDAVGAKAFDPRIELTRDKTLMQGHPYCNHKFTLKT